MFVTGFRLGAHRRHEGLTTEKKMPSPEPLLLSTDDRLARIESLLVALGTRVDRIEQLASRIDFQTRKQDEKRRSEL
jgi:hypothetical protein